MLFIIFIGIVFITSIVVTYKYKCKSKDENNKDFRIMYYIYLNATVLTGATLLLLIGFHLLVSTMKGL